MAKVIDGCHLDDESSQTSRTHTFRKRRLTISTSSSNPYDHLESEKLDPGDHNQPTQEGRKKLCLSKLDLDPKYVFSKQISLQIKKKNENFQCKHGFNTLPNGDIVKMKIDTDFSTSRPADRTNPFPKQVVSSYSCHGIEPVFEPYEEESGDDMDEMFSSCGVPGSVAKINQDRGGIVYPYGRSPKSALFAVYDGHGETGELVSQFAITEVQKRLQNHPDFQTDIEKAFMQTFVDVDKSLANENEIESAYSGTTACVALIRENKIFVSNVGDSRAVIGQVVKTCVEKDCGKTQNSCESSTVSYKPKDLSIDQNPDSPGEQERIESCGGFVSPPPEEGLSARVWIDKECTTLGLAMSRSIGDHSVKSLGVIAEPVVTVYELNPEDDFMIIATDGVWEFIDSEEAVEIVGKYIKSNGGADDSCQVLIESAAAKWHKHEGSYRDDITAIVIKLRDLWT